MSTSPSDRAPSRTPNGTLPPLIRRPKPVVDPLVRPKERRPRKANRPAAAANGINGGSHQYLLPGGGQGFTHVIPQRPSKFTPGDSSKTSTIVDDTNSHDVSGFSSTPVVPYTDYPLVITKRQLMQGLRCHVAKLYSKKKTDPRNEEDFTRPVRLHRRDPRAPPGGGGGDKDGDGLGDIDSKDGLLDDQERARQAELRARREAEREAEMAQVAPAANSGNQKRHPSKKKTEQVLRNDQTEEQKAITKLRYEEAIPWHLEDFDNKQTWVGSYEAALSDTYAQLVRRDGKFYVTPVEKWYKFTPKAPFSTLSTEEAEKFMDKKMKDPRWMADQIKAKRDKQAEQLNKKATNRLFVGKSVEEVQGGRSVLGGGTGGDGGDVDWDHEDAFADDEENQLLEGDEEEAKMANERIKKDQLSANVFGLKDEKDYVKAEMLEKKLREARKKQGKKVRNALIKVEKNYGYDTDSDNPYSTESDEEDSDTERLKAEQLKKETEEKNAAAAILKAQTASGTSSKGNNTPSNRPSKHSDPLNRTSSSTSLKRPGSPNLSEASGNESSRKKAKKKHGLSSNLNTGVSTPNGPPSRPRSPIPPIPVAASDATHLAAQPQAQRKPSVILTVKRPRAGAGSGSDGEGAGSGGEMSDGGRTKRIKLLVKNPDSKGGSPRDSRAGSPALAAAALNGSRAASPAPPLQGAAPFPSAADLKAHIPPSGTTVAELLKSFKSSIDSVEKKARFTEMLRTVSKYEKETKLLKPVD